MQDQRLNALKWGQAIPLDSSCSVSDEEQTLEEFAFETNSPLKDFVPQYLLSQASWYKALYAVHLGLRIRFGIWWYRSSKWSFTLEWSIYNSPPALHLPPPSSSGKGSVQRGEFRELKTWGVQMKLANKGAKVDAGTDMLSSFGKQP